MKITLLSLLFLLTIISYDVKAQVSVDSIQTDTLKSKEKKGSIFSGRPGKSMVMSLIIPGAGQIYNKSYLRVPVIWGAVGGMGYLVHYNTVRYNCLKDAYAASVDHLPYTFPDHCSNSGIDSLSSAGSNIYFCFRIVNGTIKVLHFFCDPFT